MPLGGGTVSGIPVTGIWKKIVDLTLTSAVTSIDITGLDLDSHKCYMWIMMFNAPAGGGYTVRLYINGDTTNNHYYQGLLYGEGGASGHSTANDAYLANINGANKDTFCQGWIMRNPVSGLPRARNNTTLDLPAGRVYDYVWGYTTSGNVTQMTFTASLASGFQIGDRFMMFKIEG